MSDKKLLGGLTKNPSFNEVRKAREASGLTQTQAADLVHSKCRTWQQWEAGDRRMHLAFWELFRIKAAMLIERKYEELK